MTDFHKIWHGDAEHICKVHGCYHYAMPPPLLLYYLLPMVTKMLQSLFSLAWFTHSKCFKSFTRDHPSNTNFHSVINFWGTFLPQSS